MVDMEGTRARKFDTYSFTILVLAIASVVFGALAFCGCGGAPAPVAPTVQAPQPQHKPTCAMAMTAPQAVQGANFFGTGSLTDCTETDWDGILQVRVNAGGMLVGVDLDRSQATPGNTLDLGQQATAFVTGYAACSGTLTWNSDEPDWSLSLDAMCGDQHVAATFSGHVYDGND